MDFEEIKELLEDYRDGAYYLTRQEVKTVKAILQFIDIKDGMYDNEAEFITTHFSYDMLLCSIKQQTKTPALLTVLENTLVELLEEGEREFYIAENMQEEMALAAFTEAMKKHNYLEIIKRLES